ncbi:ankyrin repeat domain-containing protein 18A-like [Bradysia coprophila]|uniref:ankyrin repeat domain-containing protein 18A-like n=1 Tax=Bradysia coprophila TaxID=38358 RepID=UPI00187DA637|nr:ankyrin repeat domain-containing protein 18A-like [Bradysia coprophila]
MALNQFASDWNDSFELKISVGDIKKPTQSFLCGILDFYLGTIHIDCDKMKATMGERHFKIWLVRYYNDFFRTCNPKCYPLYYGDLLKPESKKVLEILRFLLNFHHFHNAVQTEIVGTANGKIELYNQWLAKKNQLQLHREEAKIQSELKKTMLTETTRSISQYKQQLEDLTAKNVILTKEAEEAKQQVYHIRVENIDLTSQIDGAEPAIVTEHEFMALSKTIQTTDIAISELNAIEKDIQSKNKCFSQEMSRLKGEIDELSANINESSIEGLIEKEREEIKNLTELTNKVKEFRNQIENTVAKREELLESIKSLEAQLSIKRNDLASVLETCQIKQMKMESQCKLGSVTAADLEKKFEMLELKVEKLKATQKELIAMGSQVIDHIKNT